MHNIHGEEGYLALLRHILTYGNDKNDRTGVGTRSKFGAQLRFDLRDGFPLLTTKRVWTKGVFAELAWLIQGQTNIQPLLDQDVHIWDEWANPVTGDLGPIYGKQWRAWDTPYWNLDDNVPEVVDQLRNALNLLKNDPDSRRNVVSAWNAPQVPQMALAPCHTLFQFEVHDDLVSCHMYQRSADIFLGVPFNIASYAALTHVMAKCAGLGVADLIISFGDVHIYNNHFDQVREQLSRTPRPLPALFIADRVQDIDDVQTSDFVVSGYDPHPTIKAEVAV